MLNRLVLSVVVGVVVFLGCVLVGNLLASLTVSFAVTIGDFLNKYAGVFGLLAVLWYFFANPAWPRRPAV